MSSQDSVPAIVEREAMGETAELFADIRAVLGGGVVNLIWRHLATMPGALRWVWTSVRPLYLGSAPAQAAALRRELSWPDVPRFSADTLFAVGLSDADLTQIQNVLASYDHTNALALVVLSAMLVREEPSSEPAARATGPALPFSGGPMPSLPAMVDLPRPTARLIEELNGLGEDSDAFLVASMYRHLAHWPSYLALARTVLAPLDHGGQLRDLVGANRLRARAHGAALAGQLAAGPVPDSAAEALAACGRFVDHPIARMTIICAMLRDLTTVA